MPRKPNVHLSDKLLEIYLLLFARYGPQHWWPGETPFEVMVGAILTQSCVWTNVEKTIGALKSDGLLSPEALRNAPIEEIAACIHPCGYYNVKAKKLKALVEWLKVYYNDDSLHSR
jgi:endonuclease-3 related protein